MVLIVGPCLSTSCQTGGPFNKYFEAVDNDSCAQAKVFAKLHRHCFTQFGPLWPVYQWFNSCVHNIQAIQNTLLIVLGETRNISAKYWQGNASFNLISTSIICWNFVSALQCDEVSADCIKVNKVIKTAKFGSPVSILTLSLFPCNPCSVINTLVSFCFIPYFQPWFRYNRFP